MTAFKAMKGKVIGMKSRNAIKNSIEGNKRQGRAASKELLARVSLPEPDEHIYEPSELTPEVVLRMEAESDRRFRATALLEVYDILVEIAAMDGFHLTQTDSVGVLERSYES
jgi:hypothetical protein